MFNFITDRFKPNYTTKFKKWFDNSDDYIFIMENTIDAPTMDYLVRNDEFPQLDVILENKDDYKMARYWKHAHIFLCKITKNNIDYLEKALSLNRSALYLDDTFDYKDEDLDVLFGTYSNPIYVEIGSHRKFWHFSDWAERITPKFNPKIHVSFTKNTDLMCDDDTYKFNQVKSQFFILSENKSIKFSSDMTKFVTTKDQLHHLMMDTPSTKYWSIITEARLNLVGKQAHLNLLSYDLDSLVKLPARAFNNRLLIAETHKQQYNLLQLLKLKNIELNIYDISVPISAADVKQRAIFIMEENT